MGDSTIFISNNNSLALNVDHEICSVHPDKHTLTGCENASKIMEQAFALKSDGMCVLRIFFTLQWRKLNWGIFEARMEESNALQSNEWNTK